MTEQHLQIVRMPEESAWSSPEDQVPRSTTADSAKRTKASEFRIAELEAELALYHDSLGPIADQEIQAIVSNL